MTSSNSAKVKPKIYNNKISTTKDDEEEFFLPQSVKEFYKNLEGYVTSENANNAITRTRERFEASLLQYKGPIFIPTLFKNHPSHFAFCRELERSQVAVQSPMKPPAQTLVLSTFADEVYKNIQYNFRKTPLCSVFLTYQENSKVIFLGEKVFGEDAFDELLMRKEPHFYSKETEEIVKSKFVERDMSKWAELPDDCSNCYMFQVEFCMILPEVRVSTVYVTCVDCGKCTETLLNDTTIQLAKEDIKHNLTKVDFKEGDEDSVRSVIRLPPRSSSADSSCCFIEGLMGVTPLTGNVSKPSVFIRIRLFYYCNPKTLFTDIVHSDKEEKNEITEGLANVKVE